MYPGLAPVAAEEGGHRGAKNELIGWRNAGRGSREGSHTSPWVTSDAEHQHARSGMSVRDGGHVMTVMTSNLADHAAVRWVRSATAPAS